MAARNISLIGEPLINLLVLGLDFQVTDLRDRVYATLRLVDSSRHEKAKLTPSYEKLISEVYIDATVSDMRASGNLSILNITSMTMLPKDSASGQVALPSWVPRFHGAYSHVCGSPNYPFSLFEPGADNGHKCYVGDSSMPSTLLRIQGVVFDKVVQRTQTLMWTQPSWRR